MAVLEKEFNYYINNQRDLVKKYEGKVIVIVDSKVVGVFDSELEAVREASKKYKLGSFLVQVCAPGKENYTQTYHSRVIKV